MQAFIGSRISPHMVRLRDGSLLCMSVTVARTGVQMYRAQELASLGGILPEGYATGDLIPVRRPASEVLSKRTMASLEGVPICDQHPPSFVTPQNFSTWQSGHLQNVRPGPRTPDGEQTVMGDMIVRDGNLADKIERKLVRQISVGYDCIYDWDGRGFVQRNILANHVAVVPIARGGDALQIMDSAPTLSGLELACQRVGVSLAEAMQHPELWPVVRETMEALSRL
jgi:uncharacterized protein